MEISWLKEKNVLWTLMTDFSSLLLLFLNIFSNLQGPNWQDFECNARGCKTCCTEVLYASRKSPNLSNCYCLSSIESQGDWRGVAKVSSVIFKCMEIKNYSSTLIYLGIYYGWLCAIEKIVKYNFSSNFYLYIFTSFYCFLWFIVVVDFFFMVWLKWWIYFFFTCIADP